MELLTEPIILAIIGLLGGAGGIFTLIKAFIDARENKAARVEDADERLVLRLETRLDRAETRINELEALREEDRQYITKLIETLYGSSIPVPARD